jgi:sigma-B regulation protein RsbU (phosphoserine phosphatase)
MMGVIGKAAYQDYTLDLEPGSRLFLYTDGLAEANNEQEEQFDTVRILQALNAHPDGSPRELLENVRGSVNRFTGDAMQYDDLTMLCLEYRGSSDI